MYYIIFVMVLGLWIIAFNYARANKLSNLVIVLIITTLFIINRQNQD
ncbi:polymerase, partial [Escherichia coli]